MACKTRLEPVTDWPLKTKTRWPVRQRYTVSDPVMVDSPRAPMTSLQLEREEKELQDELAALADERCMFR